MLLFMDSFATWVQPSDATLAPGPGRWTSFVSNPPGNVAFSCGVQNPRFGQHPSLNFTINANGDGYLQKALTAKPTLTIGFWFYVGTSDANENVSITQFLSTGSPQVTLYVTPDLRLAVFYQTNTALLAETTAASVIPGTWQFVELRVTFDTAGLIQLNLDAQQVIASPVNTNPVGTGKADAFNLGVLASGLTIASAYQVGELYITDEIPPYNVGLLGQIAVIGLLPTGNGVTDDFIVVPQEEPNWDGVNEVPASLDSEYVQDNTVGDLDLYTGDVLPLTVTSVLAVQMSSIARKVAAPGVPAPATFVSISNVLRSGEVERDQDGVDVASTWGWYLNTQEFDPNTDQPFTPDAINAIEFGIKKAF